MNNNSVVAYTPNLENKSDLTHAPYVMWMRHSNWCDLFNIQSAYQLG